MSKEKNKKRLQALCVAREAGKVPRDPLARVLAERAMSLDGSRRGLLAQKQQAERVLADVQKRLSELDLEEAETAGLVANVPIGSFDGDPDAPPPPEPAPEPVVE